MNVKPVRWEIENSYIYIELIGDGYFLFKSDPFRPNCTFDEESLLTLKRYDFDSPWSWRPYAYESKYDMVKFKTLEHAVEAVRQIEA